MNFREAQQFMLDHLVDVLEEGERKAITQRTLEHLSDKTNWQLRMEPDISFEEEKIHRVISELKKDKPIQYILGCEYFGDLTLKVNEAVLIPRPETQELCDWILSEIKTETKRFSVLDIGTGSGCIPIYLKHHFPLLQMEAWDISSKALDVAKENAQAYHRDIFFQEKNLFAVMEEEVSRWDLIISNPPYIAPSESKEMQSRVLEYEPHEALFVTNGDVLQFYKGILSFSEKNLSPSGKIFMEVHQDHAHATQELFHAASFRTELRKDMYGNDRMLKAWRE